jgi:hypothetical protein
MSQSLINFCVGLYLCAAASLQPAALMAQEEKQPPAVDAQQETQAPVENSGELVLPPPLGGFSPRLSSHPEAAQEKRKLLVGGIDINGLYIDNAFTVGSKAVSDYQYSILPSIGLRSSTPATQWVLNYGGGVTMDQRASGNSLLQHNASAYMQHNFTRHLSSELRQEYDLTNNPFMQTSGSAPLPTVTGPGQLSPFAVPAPVTRRTSVSAANLTYQLSQHSAVGTSGSFSLQQFNNAVTNTGSSGSLIDTTAGTGRAFYLRQISAHQTIGSEYQLLDLRFDSGAARTLDQALFLFDSFSLAKNMTLSLYAGPDRTHTHNVIIQSPNFAAVIVPVIADQWSVSGGLVFSWQGKHTAFRLSGDRGVSDGGGWTGAVRLTTASMELVRGLNKHWSSTLELTYSDGRTIALPANAGNSRVTTEEGLVGLLYRLTRDVALTAQYGRIKQPNAGQFSQTLQPGHNQVQAGLTYRFQKALSQ